MAGQRCKAGRTFGLCTAAATGRGFVAAAVNLRWLAVQTDRSIVSFAVVAVAHTIRLKYYSSQNQLFMTVCFPNRSNLLRLRSSVERTSRSFGLCSRKDGE